MKKIFGYKMVKNIHELPIRKKFHGRHNIFLPYKKISAILRKKKCGYYEEMINGCGNKI